MKIKFNLFERVAGIFVLVAVGLSLVLTVGMGIKKGWFDPKIEIVTYVKSADGINPGTPVNYSGLRIGSVDTVDLKFANQVEIRFKVLKRHAKRMDTNSIVRVVRPFIIGEKALEIHDGKIPGKPIKSGEILIAQYSPDFLEFLGGNKLGIYVESLDATMRNLQKLAEAFLSNERSDKIIELFDQIFPLMEKMNSMATEVSTLSATLNEKRRMATVLKDFIKISQQMNKALPTMTRDMPELSENILKLTKNLNELSSDMKEIVPIVKEIAPEIPGASRKAVQALDETVLTLKAMQKTFFLRSSVREVKEEQQKRKPANQ
ncbi:MAG: MlaD family protein [Pseudomonadota bacterium]